MPTAKHQGLSSEAACHHKTIRGTSLFRTAAHRQKAAAFAGGKWLLVCKLRTPHTQQQVLLRTGAVRLMRTARPNWRRVKGSPWHAPAAKPFAAAACSPTPAAAGEGAAGGTGLLLPLLPPAAAAEGLSRAGAWLESSGCLLLGLAGSLAAAPEVALPLGPSQPHSWDSWCARLPCRVSPGDRADQHTVWRDG